MSSRLAFLRLPVQVFSYETSDLTHELLYPVLSLWYSPGRYMQSLSYLIVGQRLCAVSWCPLHYLFIYRRYRRVDIVVIIPVRDIRFTQHLVSLRILRHCLAYGNRGLLTQLIQFALGDIQSLAQLLISRRSSQVTLQLSCFIVQHLLHVDLILRDMNDILTLPSESVESLKVWEHEGLWRHFLCYVVVTQTLQSIGCSFYPECVLLSWCICMERAVDSRPDEVQYLFGGFRRAFLLPIGYGLHDIVLRRLYRFRRSILRRSIQTFNLFKYTRHLKPHAKPL